MGGPLDLRTAAAWRRWLRAHHATESEARLFIIKKGSAREGVRYLEALEVALCFGWIDGKLRAYDADRFVVRFTPRRRGSVWSESNRDRVERLSREGRMDTAGLVAVAAATASGAWASAARPSHVPPMPPDLRRALRANPAAWSNFRGWGNSARAACIRWVRDAKTEATRKRRIARVALRAAENQRPSIEGF